MALIESSSIDDKPIKVASPEIRNARRRQEHIGFAILMMAPALLFYTLFLIVPMLGTVVIAFTDWTGINFAEDLSKKLNVKFLVIIFTIFIILRHKLKKL